MVEQILWVLSEYMEPGRKMRIIGGWNSSGGGRGGGIEAVAAGGGGGTLPRPAYTVRVQVQRGNPNQIQTDNEFLMQAVKICADAGTPLPPETRCWASFCPMRCPAPVSAPDLLPTLPTWIMWCS